jgi:hypothetical protein
MSNQLREGAKLELIGYVQPWIVSPGATVEVKVRSSFMLHSVS